jgi:hypothetical protein
MRSAIAALFRDDSRADFLPGREVVRVRAMEFQPFAQGFDYFGVRRLIGIADGVAPKFGCQNDFLVGSQRVQRRNGFRDHEITLIPWGNVASCEFPEMAAFDPSVREIPCSPFVPDSRVEDSA